MSQYVLKSDIKAEIEKLKSVYLSIFSKGETEESCYEAISYISICNKILSLIDNIEVKDVDLIINTIIAECCDWLAICTDLNHNLIEDCRNLMLVVKDEQCKMQKGE